MAGSLKGKSFSKPKSQNLKESKTRFLFSNPNELYDRLNILLQEKRAGKSTNIIKEKLVAIVDSTIEYKCISTKQHGFSLLNCF